MIEKFKTIQRTETEKVRAEDLAMTFFGMAPAREAEAIELSIFGRKWLEKGL